MRDFEPSAKERMAHKKSEKEKAKEWDEGR